MLRLDFLLYYYLELLVYFKKNLRVFSFIVDIFIYLTDILYEFLFWFLLLCLHSKFMGSYFHTLDFKELVDQELLLDP